MNITVEVVALEKHEERVYGPLGDGAYGHRQVTSFKARLRSQDPDTTIYMTFAEGQPVPFQIGDRFAVAFLPLVDVPTVQAEAILDIGQPSLADA